MTRGLKAANVAYMQEADDDTGSVIDDNVTYATSVAPTSPSKERMNTSRKKSVRRNSASPANVLTDSDTTVLPRRDSRPKPRDKDDKKSSSSSSKRVSYAARPPPIHPNSSPLIQSGSSHRRSRDDASYYGVEPTITAASSTRPRSYTTASRPTTYYGGGSSRPPPSNMRFYSNMPTPAVLPSPTSYPPPSWAAGPGGYAIPPLQPAPTDYFGPPRAQNNLMQRFNMHRPQSAMAGRAPAPPPPIGYGDDYEPEPEERGALARRPSLRTARTDSDKSRMPPPPRPSSARPVSIRSPFAPPPAPARRPPPAYEDDVFESVASPYIDMSPTTIYEAPTMRLAHRPRRPSIVYDGGPYATEVAAANGRRSSYFSPPDNYEDKVRQASMYQEEVSGGPMPLTADALRKASKTSSRSTRSSGSHDESDWRQSATTRTTRSSNEEDFTVRVGRGGAVLKYAGAEMHCKDGAEINFSARAGPGVRSGSDKASYVDDDARTTRGDRQPNRARATSQAASHSRTAATATTATTNDPGYGYGYGYDYDYGVRPTPIPYPTQTPRGGWI